MSRHISDDEVLLSLDGELSPRRQLGVARHLGACRACRERVDGIRSTMTDVRLAYRARYADRSEMRADGRDRLVAALREVAAPDRSWFARASSSLDGLHAWRRLAAGVGVLAMCAAAFITVRGTTGPNPGVAPLGALPESALTPGAVSLLTTAELCNGVRPSRVVTEAVRQQVLRAYRMEGVPAGNYELDALITPELGGSTEPANLWPQRYHSPVWNARVKDELERVLPEMVCRQHITLAEAQEAIASDWIAAYKHYFKTDVPLHSHLGPAEDDEQAELVFVADLPVEPVATVARR